MKPLLTSIILCTVILSSCSQGVEKVNSESVNMDKVNQAKTFAVEYFAALNNGKIYEFKENEATQAMKDLLGREKQLSFHNLLLDQIGVFKSLEYAETWKQSGTVGMDIIRFKADFSKSNKSSEIRVVIDDENRVAGYWVKPWSDILK